MISLMSNRETTASRVEKDSGTALHNSNTCMKEEMPWESPSKMLILGFNRRSVAHLHLPETVSPAFSSSMIKTRRGGSSTSVPHSSVFWNLRSLTRKRRPLTTKLMPAKSSPQQLRLKNRTISSMSLEEAYRTKTNCPSSM